MSVQPRNLACVAAALAPAWAAEAATSVPDPGRAWLVVHETLLQCMFVAIALFVLATLLRVAFMPPQASAAARAKGSRNRSPDAHRSVTRAAMIVGTAGQFRGVAVPVPEGGLTLGREPLAANQLKFAVGSDVSRRHCTIEYDAATERFMVTDLGSANGTFLVATGRRLAANEASRVDPGQSILLGRDNVFELLVG